MSSPTHNLAGNLIDGALKRGLGDHIALRAGDRAWTYDELADKVRRLATGLKTLRVGKGDRVAIFMPDTLEAALSILATIYAGAIAVPLSELARANDVRDRLLNCGASVAVVDASLEPTLDEVRTEVPGLREVLVVGASGPGERDFASLIRGTSPAGSAVEVDPQDPALILYSAGARAQLDDSGDDSQAALRGIPHTHATPLLAAQRFAGEFLKIGDHDRVFSVVRLSTAYGLGVGLLFPLAVGAEAILLPEQPHSIAIFASIDELSPTVMFATPSVYRSLARDAEQQGRSRPMGSLRLCVSGAEDMPRKVMDRVRRTLDTEVVVGYGLTEAFQFVIAGDASDGRDGSCGKPLPGFDVRIVDDAGRPVDVDVIGTLEIRGPTIATRYWSEEVEVADWFTTRDRFMLDGDGYYYHCGRADDLFKVGGKWVWPGEVERALLAHEAVWECAVVGADDEDGLIKPQAFIVPNIGHDPGPMLQKTLRDYVKTELAPYKYPRWIEFVDELPKGPQGKVLRYKLRDRLKSSIAKRRAETAAE